MLKSLLETRTKVLIMVFVKPNYGAAMLTTVVIYNGVNLYFSYILQAYSNAVYRKRKTKNINDKRDFLAGKENMSCNLQLYCQRLRFIFGFFVSFFTLLFISYFLLD